MHRSQQLLLLFLELFDVVLGLHSKLLIILGFAVVHMRSVGVIIMAIEAKSPLSLQPLVVHLGCSLGLELLFLVALGKEFLVICPQESVHIFPAIRAVRVNSGASMINRTHGALLIVLVGCVLLLNAQLVHFSIVLFRAFIVLFSLFHLICVSCASLSVANLFI